MFNRFDAAIKRVVAATERFVAATVATIERFIAATELYTPRSRQLDSGRSFVPAIQVSA